MAFTVRLHLRRASACRWTAPTLDRLELPLMTPHNQDRMRHRVHRLGRRPRRRHHRHLGGRPRAHHPGARRLGDRAVRAGPARARLPAARPRGRRAACGPATPRRPSTWPGWPGCTPAGVICEIVNDDGTHEARRRSCATFADEHGLTLISIDDLIAYRRRTRTRSSGSPRPGCRPRTASSARSATASTHRRRRARRAGARRHRRRRRDVLVRVHSECLTGDVFGSLRCDCGPQLDEALRADRRRGPRRRALPARPRGPRHRPGAQAAGLPAAGRRPRHRRRQPRPRAAGRRPRTTAPARRSCATSACVGAAADQQPRQASPASRATASRSPSGCR